MSSPIPLELQEKVSSWRIRCADGTMTLEEMQEAIKYLRAGRLAAATAPKRKKTAAAAPQAEDLLNELENL